MVVGADDVPDVPVIDLASTCDESLLVEAVAQACSTTGFFQVVNHGISEVLIHQFRTQCQNYFTRLSPDVKDRQRRNATNSRGYFDDELTKQRLDWKQALDVGVPGSRDWSLPDSDPLNACLDGFNQLPSEDELAGFRSTVVEYFEACAQLSHRIATLMSAGILQSNKNCGAASSGYSIVEDLRRQHTSYLRVNYYPTCPQTEQQQQQPSSNQDPAPLGISPHKDAGFLTVLLQDDDCHSLQVWMQGAWHLVTPIPGALTINTGDMAQLWSNGRYKAPLHRVLTNPEHVRYSAPFFYNPGYDSYMEPFVNANEQSVRYHPCLWGYFRAVRFAGDLTNLGVEIQIDDFEIGEQGVAEKEEKKSSSSLPKSKHLERQRIFAEKIRFDSPFSVKAFRELLTE